VGLFLDMMVSAHLCVCLPSNTTLPWLLSLYRNLKFKDMLPRALFFFSTIAGLFQSLCISG